MDYYNVLKLPRTCTDGDIKQAYRKMALEFHPLRLRHLKCPDNFFDLINEAYEVLINPETRAIFDQNGACDFQAFKTDSLKTFEDFFATKNPYPPYPYLPRVEPSKTRPSKPKPTIQKMIHLTLFELYNGCEKKIQSPTGALTVPVPPGALNGMDFVFTEEIHGVDVTVTIEQVAHERFTRDGDDLIQVIPVTLEQALCGVTVVIRTLDERVLRVLITDVIHPNYEKVIVDEGMPILKGLNDLNRECKRGRLILRFEIIFPEYLSSASKMKVREALRDCQ